MPETPSSRARKSKVNAAKNRLKTKFSTIEVKDDVDSIVNIQDKNEEAVRRQDVIKRKQESAENSDTEDNQKDNEALDPEDKLVICLVSCLTECSRQRLRALHMSLRHYGNVDSRVTLKDVQTSLQANQIKLTPRVLQMITEIFEDARGIDYERLYQCMARAHLRTGRDSIKASNKRNDLKHKQETTLEETDSDFLRRLEEQIVRDQTYFDMDALRSEFYKYDHQGVGKMNKEGAYLICCEKTPLYGALLKNLIKRCDEENDNKISWPLFLSFLDNAQKNAWEKYPELSSLQQKGREKASVRITTPEPIDELSATTKTKVVNKLLKKNPSSADMISDLQEFKLLSVHRQVVAKTSEELENTGLVCQENDALTSIVDETQRPQLPPHETGSKDLPSHARIFSGASQKLTSQDERARLSQNVHVNDAVSEDNKGPQAVCKVAARLHDSSSATSVLGNVQDPAEVPGILKLVADNITEQDVSGIIQQDAVSIAQVDSESNQQDVSSLELDRPVDKTQQSDVQLEWIYGYSNQDGGCNLGLLTSGEMIYFIASNIVMYNRRLHQQRHYREHTENVQCLAVHSDGILVASGQQASLSDQKNKAHVRVWRADTLQTLHVLGQNEVFTKSVSLLRFMPAHRIMVSVSDCPDTKLTVWDIQTGALQAQTTVSSELLTDLEFNPWISESLVTCGTEHLVWWAVSRDTGEITVSAQPNYNMYLKGHSYTCLCHNQRGDVISGDSSGSIYIWGSKGASTLNIIRHGHQGPVTDLVLLHNHLLSSGKDGAINCWTMIKHAEKESTFQLPRSEGGVRSMLPLPGVKGSVLVVGTTTNSLIHVALNNKSPLADVALENVPITQGHTEELRAINTIRHSFLGADIVSASTDGLICKLNSKSREAVWKLWMKGYPFICVDTNVEGDQIFLGTQDGKLVILRVIKEDMTVVEILNQKIAHGAVGRVSVCPDGNMVAVAGIDADIYIYCRVRKDLADGTEMWTSAGKCKAREDNIDSIQWSTAGPDDGYQMRTSCCLQDEQIWKVPSCVEVGEDKATSNERPDFLQWLRPSQTAQGEVTCVAISPTKDLVAMATSDGQLSVVQCGEGAQATPVKCHLNTRGLCFTTDGRSLLTVGGSDVCVMQWKIV